MEEKKKNMEQMHDDDEPISPISPLALDDVSIQKVMDKNKESLKRKLMLRRSRNELVDAGIYPPLKTPPAYAEQRRQLERAKTGDLLRHKIQTRPDRQALVEQNILQDSTAHPSIQEKQKQLKRARIADGLNDRLSLRPGPLELVEGNIIPTQELHDAILDGKVTYTKTCEGEDPNRTSYFLFDEDSISDGVPSPQTAGDIEIDQSHYGSSVSSASIPSPPEIPPFLQSGPALLQQFHLQQQQQQQQQQKQLQQQLQTQPVHTTTVLTSQPQPPFIQLPCTVSPTHQPFTPQPQTTAISTPSPTNSICSISSISSTTSSKTESANGSKSSNRIKKPKPKGSSKTKVIKFHEYKGPPSVVKSQQNQLNAGNETPYHIMLQQQQLFLQWQLEMQAKNLPFILPSQKQLENAAAAAHAAAQAAAAAASSASTSSVSSATVSSTTKVSSTQNNGKPPSTLDDMKVADLKAELKKRNLPVSGAKPQLIERLKPYADVITNGAAKTGPQIQMQSPGHPPTPQQTQPIQHQHQQQPPLSSQQTVMVMSPQHENTSFQQTLQSMNTIIVQPVTPASTVGDDSMSVAGNCGSPPMSPATSDLNSSVSAPMSPESMDTGAYFNTTSSATSLKSQFSLSQSSLIKSQEPISRPSSVVPVEMEMDLGASQSHLQTSMNQTMSPEATPAYNAAVQLQNLVNVSSLQGLTHEDLVRIQARQIEELQRQLQASQYQLQRREDVVPTAQPQPQPQVKQQQQQQQIQQQQQQPQQFILQPNVSSSNATVVSQGQLLQQAILAQQAQQARQPVTSQQILIQSQPQQVHPTFTLSASSTSTKMTTSHSMMTSLLQNQTLHESLNMGQNQPKLFQFAAQPVVLATKADTKPRANPSIPVNGVTTTTSSSSLPNTPTKTASNSMPNNFYFPTEFPLKEPPKYDEAIKNKQALQQQQQLFQQNQATATFLAALAANSQQVAANSGVSKSQYMDDVLEILIRTGEMSAAEAPLTPKIGVPTSTMPAFSVSTTTPSISSATSALATLIKQQPPVYTSHTNTDSLTNTPVNLVISPAKSPSPSPSVKREPPPPLSISSSINANSPASSDFYDHITNGEDFTYGMDWAGEDSNLDLDLAMPSPNPRTPNNLSVPRDSASASSGSVHGSEPNLSSVGLSDSEGNPVTMSIDISDWLDVIMPNTGNTLTPISANFPSDPIMTPKPEDVLEMFNMKESDFNTPTDLTSGMNWEKIIESTKS